MKTLVTKPGRERETIKRERIVFGVENKLATMRSLGPHDKEKGTINQDNQIENERERERERERKFEKQITTRIVFRKKVFFSPEN